MKRKVIDVEEQPQDRRLPVSSASVWGNVVFTSGHVGWKPGTDEPYADIRNQTRQTLMYLDGVLGSCGTSLRNALKVTVYLKRIGDFDAMNDEYRQFFPHEPPARTTIEVSALAHPEVLVEIEVIAAIVDQEMKGAHG